jgi:ferrous iron transport protein B
VSYLVYQIGTLITTGQLGSGFFGGLIALAVMIAIVIYLCVRGNRNLNKESGVR